MTFTSSSVVGASASRDLLQEAVHGVSSTVSESSQPLHQQRQRLTPPRSVTPIVSLADSPSMTLPLRYGEEGDKVREDGSQEQRQGTPPERSSSPSTKSSSSSLQFDQTVSVKVIPSRFDYSQDVKQKLWSDRKECKANKLKNLKEFAKEGFDWRNVNDSDEDDLARDVIASNPSICRPTPIHPHRDVATYMVHDILDELVARPPCPCPILDEEDGDVFVSMVDEPVTRPPCPCPTTPMYGNEDDDCIDHYLDHDNYLSVVLQHHFELPKPIPMRFNPIQDPLSMLDSVTHLVDDHDFVNNHDDSINIDDLIQLQNHHTFPPATIVIPAYHPHQQVTMSIMDG